MNTGSLATEKHKKFMAPSTIQELAPEERQTVVKSAPSDAIADSHHALLLTEALHTAQNALDIRDEKVARLRARIDAGLYEIDNHQLACDILREEAELFSF